MKRILIVFSPSLLGLEQLLKVNLGTGPLVGPLTKHNRLQLGLATGDTRGDWVRSSINRC